MENEKIYEQIIILRRELQLSKHEQFVQGLINSVRVSLLEEGMRLPSINDFIHHVGFARETVCKGYRELIRLGIVRSENKVGFLSPGSDVGRFLKIALILSVADDVNEMFYKVFKSGLHKEVSVDLYFHHNNIEVFASLIGSVKGRYSYYVVAPILHPKAPSILAQLPLNKFLMIDRFIKLQGDYSYIVQEFFESSYRVFTALLDSIRRFKKGFIYIHNQDMGAPPDILKAFRWFARDRGISYEVHSEYKLDSIALGKVYFTPTNSELWLLIKDCMNHGLEVGRDVGILTHNDDAVKQLICNGITTYATDFGLMAEMAAKVISTENGLKWLYQRRYCEEIQFDGK